MGAKDTGPSPVSRSVAESGIGTPHRDQDTRFHNTFGNSRTGVALIDLEGAFMDVNHALCEFVGYSKRALRATTLQALTHPDDLEADLALRRMLTEEISSYQTEGRFIHADGYPVWGLWCVSTVCDDGRPAGFLCQVHDISKLKQMQAELIHQTLHDPLTGLPNRSLFIDRLTVALARLERSSNDVAVLFMDLDRFKRVNDSMGHAAGDRLLRAVATRLKESVRPGDSPARIGGDEFTILCEDVRGEAGAIAIAGRITEAMAQPFALDEGDVFSNASVGVAVAKQGDATDPEALIRDADAAMYHAKEKGKGRYELFSPAMHVRSSNRLGNDNALHRAIERGELRLFYQPEIRLETGRIVAAEALLRWAHPEKGLLEPDAFIPTAEEIGLILPIGDWVLGEACRQAARWAESTDKAMVVSVNISARQLPHSELVYTIRDAINESSIEPSHLFLEITESAMMEDADSAISALATLHSLGVGLSVDDFGTGYSSFNYIKTLDVDSLKIHRDFVAGVTRDPGDLAIVRAIITLAKSLGLKVVAEGVETAEQMSAIRALGCDLAQGHYFAPPQPADQISELLERHPHW
ncbi:MAG: EAL domain-containing protein [Actinobacteria bacterium]|nr:EAL domain-containing protein [Actinomycetota bacterium]